MTTSPPALLSDLRDAGVVVSDIWDLVNGNRRHRAAVPVLVTWLEGVDDLVPTEDRAAVAEALVRALSTPDAAGVAVPTLLREFRDVDSSDDLGLRWVIGNALSITASSDHFDHIESLVRDRSYGRSRQMLVQGSPRIDSARALPVLLWALEDDDVTAHALMALSRLKPHGIRERVVSLVQHPQPLVQREAKKALARLPD